jgi:hypothetical protein
LREKARDRRGRPGGNDAAWRQKADDLRQGVSERGRCDALRQAEAARNRAEGGCAKRALDLLRCKRGCVGVAEPGGDFRGKARRFERVEDPAQAPGRGRDHGQGLFDEQPGVVAKPKSAGQVVDQCVEHSHMHLPEALAPQIKLCRRQ